MGIEGLPNVGLHIGYYKETGIDSSHWQRITRLD